jgi:excisionase family DNA binding protein
MATTLAGKITISEAAKRLAVTRQRMHQLIQENNLQTEKIHPRLLLIHPRELKKIREKQKPGRKSKKDSQST